MKTGQRVVCLKSNWFNLELGRPATGPEVGKVYVILDVVADDEIWLYFSEWPNDLWNAAFFSPVDDLSDQIDRIEKEGFPAELLEEVSEYMELCLN